MSDATALDLVRGLYDYHRWANRRLFDVTAGLGEEAAGRALGTQWSVPTLRRMLAHLYGADWIWLSRWKGTSPTKLPGAEFATLASIRAPWDALEREQQAFVEALTASDLTRVVAFKNTEGKPFKLVLWPLLQHVANHATHHRSELATMLTMVSGSPPSTDRIVHELIRSGQMKG